MSNEITLSKPAPNLPAEVSTEIRLLMTSPDDYLKNLPIEKMDAERPPNAIQLSHYKQSLDRGRQLMYLSLMLIEVNDFFNVRGNMNAKQIEITAELILDNPGFYDLTLGNIKACFRHKMATAKLYDRLDGNIILDWLREFKSEMAECVYDRRLGERDSSDNAPDVVSHKVYMAMLEARANDGDKDAQQILEDYRRRAKILSPEQQRKKDLEFFKRKQEYVKQQQELRERESH